jgi:hypothetical protein
MRCGAGSVHRGGPEDGGKISDRICKIYRIKRKEGE